MLRAVLTPMALSLNRLMIAAAQRFPELAAIVARAGSLAIDRPTFAAERFLQLAVTLPQRRAPGLRTPMTEATSTLGPMIASTCSSTAAASGSRARQDRKRGRPGRTGRSAPDMIYDPRVDQTGPTNDVSVSSGWCAR